MEKELVRISSEACMEWKGQLEQNHSVGSMPFVTKESKNVDMCAKKTREVEATEDEL